MSHTLPDLIVAIQNFADVEDLRERLLPRAIKHFEAARGALFLLSEIPPAMLPSMRENPMFKTLIERHAPLHDGQMRREGQWQALNTRADHGHALVGPVLHGSELVGSLAFTRHRDAIGFNERNLADLSALCLHVSTRLTQLHNQQTALEARQLRLTGRETQIAGLVAKGFTNKQIAGQLGVSSETVKAALKTIFSKAGVKSRAQLVACLGPLTF